MPDIKFTKGFILSDADGENAYMMRLDFKNKF